MPSNFKTSIEAWQLGIELQIPISEEIHQMKVKIFILGTIIYSAAAVLFLQPAFGKQGNDGIYMEGEKVFPVEVHEVPKPRSRNEVMCELATKSKTNLDSNLDGIPLNWQIYILTRLTTYRDLISRPPSDIGNPLKDAQKDQNECFAEHTYPNDKARQVKERNHECYYETKAVNKAKAALETFKSQKFAEVFGKLDPATRALIMKIMRLQDFVNGDCAAISSSYDCPACN